MNCTFLSIAERKKLLNQHEEQFGITELPHIVLETGKEKIRTFSGSLTAEEIISLSQSINIEIIGLYIARKEHDLRLSFDATQLFSQQITKNIVEITEDQRAQWLRGHDIPIKAQKCTVVLRCGADFLGCGKSTGEKIINHVPKERRLRK